MGIFDSIKNLLGNAQSKLPENLNSVDELKAKAQDLSQQHSETINNAVDNLQTKLPGETGDKIIDAAQEKFDNFANKK
jgi:ABC-type phosphate transport system auxiliary subunit